MSLFDRFRLASRVASTQQGTGTPKAIVSPWSTGSLSSFAFPDVFGAGVPRPVTREDAMRVPAITKGRALICGTLARQPLATFRGEAKVTTPSWLTRSDTPQTPAERMLWTLDDILFNAMSLWAVTRNARREILDAVRVPVEHWRIDTDTLEIIVAGEPVSPDEVILIQGPQDALLDIAADDIRAARAMIRAWTARVTAPVPLVELHSTDATAQLTQPEADDLVEAWETARRSGGATAYTPAGIEARVHGTAEPSLFIEGRNAGRLDFANYLNLPASLLEGSQATATLTYSTTEGRRNEFVDYSLMYWAAPIEARLSADDVTPRGTRIAFDVAWLTSPTQPAQSPALED